MANAALYTIAAPSNNRFLFAFIYLWPNVRVLAEARLGADSQEPLVR